MGSVFELNVAVAILILLDVFLVCVLMDCGEARRDRERMTEKVASKPKLSEPDTRHPSERKRL